MENSKKCSATKLKFSIYLINVINKIQGIHNKYGQKKGEKRKHTLVAQTTKQNKIEIES